MVTELVVVSGSQVVAHAP
jgi:hypothetical protein